VKPIRALVFDVFGTVVDWRSGVIREVTRVLGSDVDAGGIADAWRARYVPSMNRVRRGEQPWANLDQLHRASLAELLPEFGVPAADAATLDALVLAWHKLDGWPDSVEGLTRLKKDYVIASLSNGNVSLLVDMAKYAGLPWDTVFSAEIFGHYKPDAETYEGAARLLSIEVDELLMVAAHVDDLAAARARGLRTAYIHRPTERGPKHPAPPKRDSHADFNVDSLTALADALAGRS
jgi:2-haloacid dehalogenase